jgi:tetratricopeptide (TPR) repeat protein
VLFQNNDLLKAANAFQQSYNARLLNDATDTSALYNVGLCADKGGDEEIARKAFLQLIEMNTSMTGAYTLMANTYVPVYQDAARKLADATNNINRIKYNQNIAKQELLQKEDDIKTTTDGLKKLKDAKTRQMSQDYIVKWQGDLITLKEELVRYEEALPALEAIVAENQKIADEAALNAAKYADLATVRFPDDYNTLINAASIHLTIDNSDRAEEILNGMKEQYSDNKLVFYALGVAYGMMNEDTKAEEAYNQALELDPDYFEPAYNLAVLYIDKGAALELKAGNLPLNAKSEYEALTKQASELYKKATPTIEKSLELKPNDQAVMEALQRLYLFLSKSDASYFQKYQDIKSQIEELYPSN